MFKQTINNLHGCQYTSESYKAVSWARFYSTSMLLNYQHSLNQIQFSIQTTLIYTNQIQNQIQYQLQEHLKMTFLNS